MEYLIFYFINKISLKWEMQGTTISKSGEQVTLQGQKCIDFKIVKINHFNKHYFNINN